MYYYAVMAHIPGEASVVDLNDLLQDLLVSPHKVESEVDGVARELQNVRVACKCHVSAGFQKYIASFLKFWTWLRFLIHLPDIIQQGKIKFCFVILDSIQTSILKLPPF